MIIFYIFGQKPGTGAQGWMAQGSKGERIFSLFSSFIYSGSLLFFRPDRDKRTTWACHIISIPT